MALAALTDEACFRVRSGMLDSAVRGLLMAVLGMRFFDEFRRIRPFRPPVTYLLLIVNCIQCGAYVVRFLLDDV